jgi:outer membrane immunogenic protein
MKHLLLASTAFLALTAAASAADLPMVQPYAAAAPVAYNWTGFSIGLQAGYSFGSSNASALEFDTDLDGAFGDVVIAGGGDAFAPGFSDDFEGGFSGGVNVGYDHQFGAFVLGAVLDINYVDASDNVTGFSVTPAFYSFDRDVDFLATARLRAGYAYDRFMIYATGGLAYAKLDYGFSTNSPAAFGGVSGGDEDAWGYTVGAGVEAMVTEKISVGLEYLYTDLDAEAQTARFSGGAFGAGTDMRPNDDGLDLHTVRAKVAYRF